MAQNMIGRVVWSVVLFLLSIIIAVGLIDVLTTRASATAFSVLNWIAFGNATTELVLAWIVGVVGILTLLGILFMAIKNLFK